MAISTKNVKPTQGGNFIPKVLEPGSFIVKLNEINFEKPKYSKSNEDHLDIVLSLESEPIAGFEGFAIDKNDPSKGTYEGRIGQVKAGRYAFSTFTNIKTGKTVDRDDMILSFLAMLCTATDCIDWFEQIDGKFNTVEDLLTAFNREKPFKDTFFHVTLGGTAYNNQSGYRAYNLFIVKNQKSSFGMVSLDNSEKLVEFNEADHIIIPKNLESESNKNQNFGSSSKNDDFSLDDEPMGVIDPNGFDDFEDFEPVGEDSDDF